MPVDVKASAVAFLFEECDSKRKCLVRRCFHYPKKARHSKTDISCGQLGADLATRSTTRLTPSATACEDNVAPVTASMSAPI